MLIKKLYNLCLSIGICAVMALSSINAFAGTISDQTEKRLGSQSIYQTAADISKQGWTSSQSVVLVNALNSDAYSAATLAYLKNAPVIVTSQDGLISEAESEIQRLNAKDIYIVGSTKYVDAGTEDYLKSKGYNVERISNSNIFDTAIDVADKVIHEKPTDTVFISSNMNIFDTVSASTFAAKNGYPILFTDKNILTGDTKNALKKWGIKKAYVLGAPEMFSSEVESSLNSIGINTTRIQGNDKYEISMNLIKQFDKGDYKGLTLVSGYSLPNVLPASVLAAKENAPVMLYDKGYISSDVSNFVNSKASHLYAGGDERLITDQVLSSILSQSNVKNTPVVTTPILTSSPKFSVSDINDAWRTKYFKWEPGHYSGIKQAYFDSITKAVADGSLSQESAESQLNAISPWAEPDGITSHKILRVKVKVYETSNNNVQEIINYLYYNRILTGGTYDNSYAYYDSSTGKYRIVIIGLDLINTITTITTTYAK